MNRSRFVLLALLLGTTSSASAQLSVQSGIDIDFDGDGTADVTAAGACIEAFSPDGVSVTVRPDDANLFYEVEARTKTGFLIGFDDTTIPVFGTTLIVVETPGTEGDPDTADCVDMREVVAASAVIRTFGGPDVIWTGQAPGIVFAGEGDDEVHSNFTGIGGPGLTTMTVLGGEGNDNIVGSPTGSGEIYLGQGGMDEIESGAGGNFIWGGTDSDEIACGDLISGDFAAGDQGLSFSGLFVPGGSTATNNFLINNGITAPPGCSATLISFAQVLDNDNGVQGNDIIIGGNLNDQIMGDAGFDLIGASGGDDLVDGNAGRDIISGDSGDDMVFGGVGGGIFTGSFPTMGDFVMGLSGDDLVSSGSSAFPTFPDDAFFTISEADTLDGGTGVDTAVSDSTDIVLNVP